MAAQSATSVLEEFPGRREDLIPILQKIQNVEGFISQQSLKAVARKLRMSENVIYGVVTFYAQFRFHPPGEHTVHVCMGTACHVRGGQQLLESLEWRLGVKEGETTEDGKFDLSRVACLGCCALAPVVKVDDRIYGQLSVVKLGRLMNEYKKAGSAQAGR
jgi:NADH:ubiquinone oxidoreductase subunit E